MPSVQPFAGLRYTQRAGELETVLSPPYDVISPDEQARLEAASAYNAVHLELPRDRAGAPGSRYAAAAATLQSWRQAGVLARDDLPAYYLSLTEFEHAGTRYQRRDLLAAVAVAPWSAGHILPHEHTMAGPKQDRLELLKNTHLNVSPIWLLQREPVEPLQAAWSSAEQHPALMDVFWRNERHRVWAISDRATVAAMQEAFERSGPLYIADGHHRYETSLAFAEQTPGLSGARAVLAAITLADDPGLVVLPTHRLLGQPAQSLDLQDTAAAWADIFQVEHCPVSDNAPPEQVDALMQQLASAGRQGPAFGIYGLGRLDLFRLLALRAGKAAAAGLPADRSDAWKSLDVALLHSLLLDRLVAETGKPRDEVLAYTRDPHAAFEAVRQGDAAAALLLNPTPVHAVLAVADAHDRMPEKSTYFYPKPPAGLVLRSLDA